MVIKQKKSSSLIYQWDAKMKNNTPYYAVIFTSKLVQQSDAYDTMAAKMAVLSSKHKGFLGMDSARSKVGITICYWETLEDIQNWKQNIEHQEAQQLGISDWYDYYNVRICKVEREYEFTRS